MRRAQLARTKAHRHLLVRRDKSASAWHHTTQVHLRLTHILEGYLKALDHLDEIISLIRGSQTTEEARTGLMERFELDELQANAILEMF